MLGEHPDRVVAGDAVVEVVPQRGEELVETCDRMRVLVGVFEEGADPGFLGGSDLGDVFGPGLHVAPVADLFNDPGVDGVVPLVEVG